MISPRASRSIRCLRCFNGSSKPSQISGSPGINSRSGQAWAARKALIYALGRELTLADDKVVDEIVRQVRDKKDSTRALIEAVAMSYPFRHRRRAR